MLTNLVLLGAYSNSTILRKVAVNRNSECNVRIVSAETEQDGDIDALLAQSGIRVLERVSQREAETCAEVICGKLGPAGMATMKEFLCND